MKRIAIVLSIAVIVALCLPINAAAAGDSLIVNGSFETGDYFGWTLWEGNPGSPSHNYTNGTWGIAQDGEVIGYGQYTHDYYDNSIVRQRSAGLPRTYVATDGQYLAYQLMNGPEEHRIYQDVSLPTGVSTLTWDMSYHNFAVGFSSDQYIAVYIRDLDDNILETLYITQYGVSPQSIPMTSFTCDISQYGGSEVRIDVYMKVLRYYLVADFDNFVIENPQRPPGWDKGKKSGWDGSQPLGLEKKNKIPAGFDQGNKDGWD